MKALQQLMEGTGPGVAPLITDDVMDLIYRWVQRSFHLYQIKSETHTLIATEWLSADSVAWCAHPVTRYLC
jgi:hypothetical protein